MATTLVHGCHTLRVERGILQGLAAFRWAAWTWTATVLLVARDDLTRPWLAVLLVGLAFAVTAALTVILRTDPLGLLRPGPIIVELVVALALVICDGWAFGADHAFSTSQSLGVAWPMAAVLSTGVAFGGWAGAAAGVCGGLARMGGAAGQRRQPHRRGTRAVLGLDGLPLRARRAVSRATSRCCCAAPSARSPPPGRERRWPARCTTACCRPSRSSSGAPTTPTSRGWPASRSATCASSSSARRPTGRADCERSAPRSAPRPRRFEDTFGGRAEVVLDDDLPSLDEAEVRALAGAVGEALTNAGKHGDAQRVTVYVEPADDGGVFCSVKDDGAGFDTAAVPRGRRAGPVDPGADGRGGRPVEIDSAPGRGTEVRLWLPR